MNTFTNLAIARVTFIPVAVALCAFTAHADGASRDERDHVGERDVFSGVLSRRRGIVPAVTDDRRRSSPLRLGERAKERGRLGE